LHVGEGFTLDFLFSANLNLSLALERLRCCNSIISSFLGYSFFDPILFFPYLYGIGPISIEAERGRDINLGPKNLALPFLTRLHSLSSALFASRDPEQSRRTAGQERAGVRSLLHLEFWGR
jgi:hypothetical protein